MEDLFRTQMEAYRVEPSPGLWQKVHARIFWKQFLGFSIGTFNVYYLAAVILAAGIGSYIWLSGSPEPDPASLGQEMEQAGEALTSAPTGRDVPPLQEAETREKEISLAAPAVQSAEVRKEAAEKLETGSGKAVQLTPDKSFDRAGEGQGKPAEKQGNRKSESMKVRAAFLPTLVEGCSPLAVQFDNRSENAVSFLWTFGDGGNSVEKEPSYVFDQPGEYQVTLRVTGIDGLEYRAQQVIRVFETPKALFELEDNADLSRNQPVYFYNYSRNAEYFAWDFGDRQHSDLAEPIHFYDKPGNYTIKLKVWNSQQCYDSLIITNAFSGEEGSIKFPNAFSPNLTGPTGGYYVVNDVSNSIFHPVVSGELVEYQLKIFNRQGLQIFESNDIAFGWDGYYQDQLANQGVYIWKARGKFSNGKTFVESGDLTLIREHRP